MTRRLIITTIIASILLAGCTFFLSNPTVAPVPTAIIPVGATSTPIIIYITATPLSPAEQTATADLVVATTQIPAISTTPAPTSSNDGISIIKAEDLGGGRANITWEVTGSFPAGFEVIWSETNPVPTFPTNSSNYLSDPNTRTVQIVGQPGKTYYLRVCRYANNACNLYSNVAQIMFSGPTATPVVIYPTAIYPTMTSTPWLPGYNPLGTPIPADAGIKIIHVIKTASGKATVYWQAYGSFPNGFKLIYTTANRMPTYGMYPDISVGGSARSAEISGKVGDTYFLRLCRFTGTTCDVYSPVYEFLFTAMDPTKTPTGTLVSDSLTITSISNSAPGQAIIYWTASGSFSNGFRLVYSKTHSSPTFGSDPYYVIKDGTIRAAYINGDKGYTYYYRICRYTGSTCDIYSATYTFLYAGAKATNTPIPTKTRTPTTIPPTRTPVPPTHTPVPPSPTTGTPTETPISF